MKYQKDPEKSLTYGLADKNKLETDQQNVEKS